MMKKIWKITITMSVICCFLMGCGSTSDVSVKTNSSNTVEKVLDNQIEKENNSSEESTEETEVKPRTKTISMDELTEGVDIDMTKMGSDMIYATVFQLMTSPDDYEGQIIRIKGNYYASWYEPTAQYYHYAIIKDATACCSQGLEFEWGDGTHKFPDEYPEDGEEVIITGTFETYIEDGDPNLYCRLANATVNGNQ